MHAIGFLSGLFPLSLQGHIYKPHQILLSPGNGINIVVSCEELEKGDLVERGRVWGQRKSLVPWLERGLWDKGLFVPNGTNVLDLSI